MEVTIVGVGKVGGALALALPKAGHKIEQLIVHDRRIADRVSKLNGSGTKIQRWSSVRTIDSQLVLICTRDPEIPSAVESLAQFVRPGQIVLHTSGSLTSEILTSLAKAKCEIGSVHPLVSVSDAVKGSERFSGAYFCVEGTRKAVSVSRRIVRGLGGKTFTVPTDKKTLYHASAVTVAGHVVALFDTGVEMLTHCGISRREAQKVLLPLTKSTLENLSQQDTADALTGTFARLDIDGLERHIRAFKDIPPGLSEIYFALGERSLSLIESKGVKDPRIAEMRRMIFVAKGKRR